ncbi:Guanine nucleotide exchange factor lte1 [Microbotryomycetes sp. JL201]|nr:Guanine nucleotide exchange factor lte1 [Microbotryomycetes sp. JL201]
MDADIDHAFVETTNKRAAQVMAAHYAKEGRGEHNIIEKQVDGKTVYCIRPRPRPTYDDDFVPAQRAVKQKTSAPSLSLPRPIRHSRSIPILRSNNPPANRGQSDKPAFNIAQRALRRAGSTPLLSMRFQATGPEATDGSAQFPKRGQTIGPASVQAGDVFGSIIGRSRRAEQDNRTGDPSRSASQDLPSDLRSALRSEAEFVAGAFSAPVFGRGVKSSTGLERPFDFSMRNVNSNESIRTARDRERAGSRPPRFQDMNIFNEMQQAAEPSSPGLPQSRSTMSIVSSRSSLSRASAHRITVAQPSAEDTQYAVWGYKHSIHAPSSPPTAISNHRPHHDVYSAASTGSPGTASSARWSVRDRQSVSSAPTSVRLSVGSGDGSQKSQLVLMAATIERLVAELTSKIDAELLVTFFLTFRSYLEPMDLMRLLITRFSWAIQHDDTPEGDAERRIVRVRTFVVLRHWLLNHFMDDFYPNRELRTLFTTWLNESSKAPEFKASQKDMRLIKGLKKVVRKVKETYVVTGPAGIAQAMSQIEEEDRSVDRGLEDDVDFELTKAQNLQGPWSEATLNPVQPLELYSPASSAFSASRLASPLLPASTSSSTSQTISRSLSSAVGRLKRLKSFANAKDRRVSVGGSSFVGTDGDGDVLADKTRLESYLHALGVASHDPVVTSVETESFGSKMSSTSTVVDQVEAKAQDDAKIESVQIVAGVLPPVMELPQTPSDKMSFGSDESPTAYFFSSNRPQSTRVQLDDVDLSDEDEDVVEAKRVLKRLPAIGNLRQGIRAHESLSRRSTLSNDSTERFRAPSFVGYNRESVSFVDDEEGYSPARAAEIVPGFTLEGLDDSDDEDSGGIEAALKRLEGIVDDTKEKEKARRVEQQMQKSAALLMQSKEEPKESTPRESLRPSVISSDAPKMQSLVAEDRAATSSVEPESVPPTAMEPDAVLVNTAPPTLPSTLTTTVKKPLMHEPSVSKLFAGALPNPLRTSRLLPAVTGAASAPLHKSFILHCRTEVLAQQLCLIERDLFRTIKWQELTSSAWKRTSESCTKVVDWESYVKDRRRRLLQAKKSKTEDQHVDTAIQSMIARFNLTANWVASEIVLTLNLEDRVVVLAKFIRLAFKCYCQSNFQTLTGVMAGLQLPEVERLRKTWSRLPSWEMRKFRGLQTFVSHEKQFKHLRDVTNAIVAEYGPPGQRAGLSTANKQANGRFIKGSPVPLGCLPFLGLILRDLSVNDELPTYLESGTRESAPSSATLYPLVNIHKMRTIANLTQRVLAFQEFAEGYPFQVDAKVYLKALKLRALDSTTLQQLAARIEA